MPPFIILDPLTGYPAGERRIDLERQARACRLLAICHEAAGNLDIAERYRAEERAVRACITLREAHHDNPHPQDSL